MSAAAISALLFGELVEPRLAGQPLPVAAVAVRRARRAGAWPVSRCRFLPSLFGEAVEPRLAGQPLPVPAVAVR
jgi:hypothetical protein